MRGQTFSHYFKLTSLFLLLHCQALEGVRFLNIRANSLRLLKVGHLSVKSDRVLVNNIRKPSCIAYNYEEQTIYWINAEKTKIQRIKIDSPTKPEDVVRLFPEWRPSRLAVDWVGGNLYWSEGGQFGRKGRIVIAHAKDRYEESLYISNIRRPRDIALDSTKGLMFWTDVGRHSKIEKANMDGSHRSTVVLFSASNPLALELDHREEKIYWTESRHGQGSIYRISYDGSAQPELVHSGSFVPLAGVLAVHRKRIYWSDKSTMSIRSVKKFGPSKRRKVEGTTATGILVFEPDRQEKPRVSQGTCKENNGGCSHFCLPAPRGYTCGCPAHFTHFNKSCVPTQFLLYAKRTGLHYISLGNPEQTDTTLPITGIDGAHALDFDPVNKYVYWTDNVQKNIKRAPIYGTNISLAVEIVASQRLMKPEGIAVDWIARNIYWTDSGSNMIEVSKADGSIRKVLLRKDLDEPRTIAVDPMKGYMYWNDWGKTPKIERANLDGSKRIAIVQSAIVWPNGLTIDYSEQKIYWSDAKLDKVEVMDIDGSNRIVVVKGVPHPFSVSVLGDRLYWTDWQTWALVCVDKLTGHNQRKVIDKKLELMGLKAVNLSMALGSNPCKGGWCRHMCLSTPTSARCVTEGGSVRQVDRGRVHFPTLMYTDRQNIKTIKQRITPKNNRQYDEKLVINGLDHAVALDFDYEQGLVFWTDAQSEKIKKAYIHSKDRKVQEVVSVGLKRPEGIAVDWITKKLYWTDIWDSNTEASRIEVSSYDGMQRKILVWENLGKPRAVAVDPREGYIFWTDCGANAKIERAGMDGSDRRVIISKNIALPSGLTIDYDARTIYWTDTTLRLISRASYDGSNRQTLLSDVLSHPYSLTLHGSVIYWTDWETKSIHAFNTSALTFERVKSRINEPMGIHVYEKHRQPPLSPALNPCHTNNGDCSHLCLLAPRAKSCACPTGMKLLPDGKNCNEVPTQFLLYAKRTGLHYISLGNPEQTDTTLPITGIDGAHALDFDPVNKYVYWTDNVQKNIKRAPIYGTNISLAVEIVASQRLMKPEGIAVDWIARNIYWTDSGSNMIEVSKADGSIRKVLLRKDLDEPRTIAVDPMKGYMYWNDWGKTPKIERANLDGSKRIAIVQSAIVWPNGLTIDYSEQKIYWSDAKLDKVEVMDIDGSNRIVVVKGVPHPFSVSVLGDRLYWTDWQTGALVCVDKLTGHNQRKVIDKKLELMGLKAVNLSMALGSNPCKGGWCRHMCLSTPTSARCVTEGGSVRQVDRGRVHFPTLMYTDRQNIKTIKQRITPKNNRQYDEKLVINGLDHAVALDFDYEQGLVFWTDAQSEKIKKAYIHSKDRKVQEVVSVGLKRPEGIAVDWITKKLYWTDIWDSNTEANRIEVSSYDGMQRKILVWENLGKPRAVAVDPREGYIFWTDCGANAKIERAGMDGSDRRVIISKNIALPSGLTIDYDARTIYWTDTTLRLISRASYDGSNRQTLLSDVLSHPYSLTLHGSVIYWTDWETKSIHAFNTSALTFERVKSRINEPMGIHVYEKHRQPPLSPALNPCHTNNGDCSHLCLLAPRAKSCACPTGMKLLPDGKNCDEGPHKFILFSRGLDIQRISLDTSDRTNVVLPIPGIKRAAGLSFDPVDRYVYWSDEYELDIKRANMNGQNVETVVSSGIQLPVGVAVDWIARNLYWMDTGVDKIQVSRLNGSSKKTLIEDNLDEPGEIVVSPATGYMFWTDWGEHPKIERADLDGSNRRVLVSSNISNPSTLAIDHREQKIYWGDTTLDKIEVMDMDGSHRRVIVKSGLDGVFGLGVLGDRLYWTDWLENSLSSANKHTGQDVRLLKKLPDLLRLQAVNLDLPLGINPCNHNNGGCSHLCLFKPSGAICACPSGTDVCSGQNVSFKRLLL